MGYEIVVGWFVTDEAGYQRYRDGMMPILHAHGGAFGYDLRVSQVLRSRADHDTPPERVSSTAAAHADRVSCSPQASGGSSSFVAAHPATDTASVTSTMRIIQGGKS